jgi:hypothetical protein
MNKTDDRCLRFGLQVGSKDCNSSIQMTEVIAWEGRTVDKEVKAKTTHQSMISGRDPKARFTSKENEFPYSSAKRYAKVVTHGIGQ